MARSAGDYLGISTELWAMEQATFTWTLHRPSPGQLWPPPTINVASTYAGDKFFLYVALSRKEK